MSVYLDKRDRTYRFDFQFKDSRYSKAGFKTKKAARDAESELRRELEREGSLIPTDMGFLTLVNKHLDFLKAYRSEAHYREYRYMAKRWVKEWGSQKIADICEEDIERLLEKRKKISSFAANKDLRYLRATFNFAKKRRWLRYNPTEGVEFFPIEKKKRYIPPVADIEKVLAVASQDERDYLIVLADTLARVGEINSRFKWTDIDWDKRTITLYTRKSRGGNLVPRTVPMTQRLYEILSRRFEDRDPEKEWVFWHKWWDRKGNLMEGPYTYRSKLMKSLCAKAKVPYFTFHAFRHAVASLLEQNNVPVGSIQELLGHQNRSTTEIYLQTVGEAKQKAISTLEEIWKSPTKSPTKGQSLDQLEAASNWIN